MPTSTTIPAELTHLLEEPNYGMLGTIRPDDTVQVNPMWFLFRDGRLRFTHTTKRAKFRNLQHNPAMSLAVLDPTDPFVYIELRGRLIEVVPDPEGAFYVELGRRYGNAGQEAPPDSADRVVLVMSVETVTVK
jgi:PPOX class probable F420-dependent enzyme